MEPAKAYPLLRSRARRSGALLPALFAAFAADPVLFSNSATAQPMPQEAGVWIDHSGGGAVEVYTCADRADRLCGRIVWLKEPLNAQGVPKRDRYNPNEALQKRPICGLPVLGNLAKIPDGSYDGGWIYDPKAGKSYSAAIQRGKGNQLVVTGYVGMKFLSKSFTWTRAPDDLPRCAGAPPPALEAAVKKPAPPAATAAKKPATPPPSAAAAAVAKPTAPPPAAKSATATEAPTAPRIAPAAPKAAAALAEPEIPLPEPKPPAVSTAAPVPPVPKPVAAKPPLKKTIPPESAVKAPATKAATTKSGISPEGTKAAAPADGTKAATGTPAKPSDPTSEQQAADTTAAPPPKKKASSSPVTGFSWELVTPPGEN